MTAEIDGAIWALSTAFEGLSVGSRSACASKQRDCPQWPALGEKSGELRLVELEHQKRAYVKGIDRQNGRELASPGPTALPAVRAFEVDAGYDGLVGRQQRRRGSRSCFWRAPA